MWPLRQGSRRFSTSGCYSRCSAEPPFRVGGGDDDCKESKADHDGDARGDGKWVAAMRAESLCGKCSTEISHGDGESG